MTSSAPRQNWIFWPELPLSNRNCILVAGRPLRAGIVFLQLSQDGIRDAANPSHDVRPCAF
jgi:hypothetical protein